MRNDSTLMHIVRLTVTLLTICAVVAAVLAGVNMITKDKIAEIQNQKIEKAIQEVIPNAQDVQQLPLSGDAGIVQAVYTANGSYALQVAPGGFDGEVIMMVGISEGKVAGISVISHTETPGLGAVAAAQNAKGEAFRGQFVGQEGTLAIGDQIDAMSGATITSTAVVTGVNAALQYVANMG
ncbi:MAG: RnfABCDGE type electron transport complex subunit G [Oscillospiraceae bacterium]|nr:RnfABCDGE type electron transport complex subunit G [Oscillospiraceae bacterium]